MAPSEFIGRKRRVLCAALPQPGRPIELPEAEAQHLVRVLRTPEGALVEAMDGSGGSVAANVRFRGDRVLLEYSSSLAAAGTTKTGETVPVTLEIAVLKGDAFAWAIEKAVELGARRLVPLLCERTIVKVAHGQAEKFVDRWRKIADQSLKQCGRLSRLEILPPISLPDYLVPGPAENTGLRCRYWCDESVAGETQGIQLPTEATAAHLLIGPEGGWSERERELISGSEDTGLALHRVSLGPLVLRAETAAIAGLCLLADQFRTHNLTH